MQSTVLDSERERYNRLARLWHTPGGVFSTLQAFTSLRLAYVREAIAQAEVEPSGPIYVPAKGLAGYKILDVGCGGGFMSEAMAKEGAYVTAIDISEKVIEANKERQSDTADISIRDNIGYYRCDVESLTQLHTFDDRKCHNGWLGWIAELIFPNSKCEAHQAVQSMPRQGFDVILASEVLEHVDRPRLFLHCLDRLLKSDGALIITTPNRTPFSKFMMITMAENVLKMIPKGLHDWRRFVKWRELSAFMTNQPIPGSISPMALITGDRERYLVDSPLLQSPDDDARVRSRYEVLPNSTGVMLWPGRIWSRFPLKWMCYMMTFKKLDDA